MTQLPSWRIFCRALSVAGLPECQEPMGHEGAHIFSHVPAEVLIDRCAIMLKEFKSLLKSQNEERST